MVGMGTTSSPISTIEILPNPKMYLAVFIVDMKIYNRECLTFISSPINRGFSKYNTNGSVNKLISGGQESTHIYRRGFQQILNRNEKHNSEQTFITDISF